MNILNLPKQDEVVPEYQKSISSKTSSNINNSEIGKIKTNPELL